MKNIILFIWQLPQNILGIIIVLFTKAKLRKVESIKFYFTNYAYFGVSLGRFIILGSYYENIDIKHESGHQKQSLYLGWLYLLVIGLPSFIGNIWDRLFHRTWSVHKRKKWYYSSPWERWADKLGNVNRWGNL